MDTQLYIKILIVQASFLHCFFACFTLVFFWLQWKKEPMELWMELWTGYP